MPDTVDTFVSSMNALHNINIRRDYLAYDESTYEKITPLARFVFEFFIYNSLYRVNWERSVSREIVHHNSERCTESQQQSAFEHFIQARIGMETTILKRAFSRPLRHNMQNRLSAYFRESDQKCQRFFQDFQSLCKMPEDSLNFESPDDFFQKIENCRRFVYSVRCNLFHGRKNIQKVMDTMQAERFGVYGFFLAGLISLFFEAFRNGETESRLFDDR